MQVGASEDYDIFIGDWNAQTINLVRTPEGQCQAQWPSGDGDLAVQGARLEAGTHCCVLQPWVPVRFGTIILCIGPADTTWPDDADLLQRLFAPEPPVAAAAQRARRKFPLMAAGITLAALASSAAVIAVNHNTDRLPSLHMPQEPVTTLRQALADKRWPDLEVLDQRDKFVVRGVLENRQDAVEVHQRLDDMRLDKPVIRHFMDAPAIADLVHESVPDTGLDVNRIGARSFEVTGRSTHVERTQQALSRLGADLDHVGVKVVSSVEALVEGSARVSGTLTDRQGVSFARTRDGVKHIVSPAESATSAATKADKSPAHTR